MATTTASGSVCASTGASPAVASTPVATGQSASTPPRPATMDLVARQGGGGDRDGGAAAAREPTNVVIVDEDIDDGTSVDPAPKRQKKSTSKVWEFFTKSTVIHKKDDGQTENQVWAKCSKCKFKTRGESHRGTTVLWNHLQTHSIKPGQQQLQVKKGEGNNAAVQTFKYDPEVSLNKFYMAMVIHEYPFKMVEHEFFVDFIKSMRPAFSFKSRTTTRKEIMEMYLVEKKKLFEQLKHLCCRFSATMDMWTSNQNKGYMCITIHWIDDDWHMQKRIICLPHVKGRHKGQVLATEFIKGVMSWNLEKRLFSLTLDNAGNNNSCVRVVVKELNDLAKLNKSPPLICNGVFFHVRCLCHILNLVAQDGLSIIGSSVKNIRAVIVIVKNSTLQWEEFQKCAEFFELNNKSGLPLDVPTRWNSTYDMLSQAIYYKNAIQRLVYVHKDKYGHCAPSTDEWDKAESFCKCLKTLNDLTVLFSGSQYPTANLFWWKFCELKLTLQEWCESADITIACMAVAMKKKYDKYWEKCNIALAVACFLDPRYKKKLVEYFMKKIYNDRAPVEISHFMDIVKQLFEAYLCSASECLKPNAQPKSNASASHGRDASAIADIEEYLYEDEAAANCGELNELDEYMKVKLYRPVDSTGQCVEFDILSWWKSNQARYPVLSRLARDVLAIQVSTVASESAFSSSGRIVNKFRSRLEPEAVEALVCTKDWYIASNKGKMIVYTASCLIIHLVP